jgi:hypothetical protein
MQNNSLWKIFDECLNKYLLEFQGFNRVFGNVRHWDTVRFCCLEEIVNPLNKTTHYN